MLDGSQLPPRKWVQQFPTFRSISMAKHGRPSQKLLKSCSLRSPTFRVNIVARLTTPVVRDEKAKNRKSRVSAKVTGMYLIWRIKICSNNICNLAPGNRTAQFKKKQLDPIFVSASLDSPKITTKSEEAHRSPMSPVCVNSLHFTAAGSDVY